MPDLTEAERIALRSAVIVYRQQLDKYPYGDQESILSALTSAERNLHL